MHFPDKNLNKRTVHKTQLKTCLRSKIYFQFEIKQTLTNEIVFTVLIPHNLNHKIKPKTLMPCILSSGLNKSWYKVRVIVHVKLKTLKKLIFLKCFNKTLVTIFESTD